MEVAKSLLKDENYIGDLMDIFIRAGVTNFTITNGREDHIANINLEGVNNINTFEDLIECASPKKHIEAIGNKIWPGLTKADIDRIEKRVNRKAKLKTT